MTRRWRALNEFWRDALGGEWRCTVAGTPGTWRQINWAAVTADPASGTIPVGYWIWNATSGYLKRHAGGYVWQVPGGVETTAKVSFRGTRIPTPYFSQPVTPALLPRLTQSRTGEPGPNSESPVRSSQTPRAHLNVRICAGCLKTLRAHSRSDFASDFSHEVLRRGSRADVRLMRSNLDESKQIGAEDSRLVVTYSPHRSNELVRDNRNPDRHQPLWVLKWVLTCSAARRFSLRQARSGSPAWSDS